MTGIFVDRRNHRIRKASERANRETGAAFLWPYALGGPGIPCRAASLTNASRLSPDSLGGASLFDDVTVSVLRRDIPTAMPNGTALPFPREMDKCGFRPGPGLPVRTMKIQMVEHPPGGEAVTFHLNNFSEGA